MNYLCLTIVLLCACLHRIAYRWIAESRAEIARVKREIRRVEHEKCPVNY